MDIGLPELLVVLIILLLLFGASRLPKLAKSIGESAGELKKGLNSGITDDDKESKTKSKNS